MRAFELRGRLGWVAAVLAIAAHANAADPVIVYDNALSASWANWSWNTSVGSVTSPAHAGSAMSVTHNAAWAGLYLHANSPVTTADYATVRFWIHGGVSGGQALQFYAVDASGASSTTQSLSPLTGGSWSMVEIPTASLGLTTIGGLVWQDRAGHAQPTYYVDDITLVPGAAPPPGEGPALTVDAAADRHAISPYIYGMNFADAGLAAEIDLPVNRFGGNGTTRYNWQLDTSNHAMDWFFENIPDDNPAPGSLPDGSSADRFVEADRANGAQTIMTLPLIGWTPKTRAYSCGFSVAKYGAQQQVDPWRTDCGNGVRTNGTPVTGNDPTDTSLAITPTFVQSWIGHLIGRYGTAAGGGVRFYCLDNEPALWNSTHRDVHPTPLSYDELRDRTSQYAAAVKASDPTALTLGPVEWGWSGYFYSAADVAAGGNWWDTRPDRRAHGDVPLVDWYLQQMQGYESAHGVRILDYLDLHFYPQADVALQPAGDAAKQARRLRSTRALWDSTYVDESWIADTVRLIPRMRDWVNANYPGTKVAITEYNWGGLESINGALAQADVLGIFGREGLDLATIWDPPASSSPGAFAFRMYRNYDGAGGKFGGTAVRGTSADQSQVAVYAALRGSWLTAMIINKATQALTSALSVANFTATGPARVYRYSGADLVHIVHEPDLALDAGQVSLALPASSITLLVIPGPAMSGDCDGDGDVDLGDYGTLAACMAGPATAPPPSCACADANGNGRIDLADFSALQRAIEP